MNYFAHLYFAQPTIASTVGNLLGDFCRGVKIGTLPRDIRAGLNNHRAVDRFTDSHAIIVELKSCFSKPRKRFAGIALDVYFDHLLMSHWSQFDKRDLSEVIRAQYQLMEQGQDLMPHDDMRNTTMRMIKYDWFGSYQEIDSIAEALDRIAARIRFKNKFQNTIEDLHQHQQTIQQGFLDFFPQLIEHVKTIDLESEHFQAD